MATLFCEYCQRETKFLPISHIIRISEVSRSTIYYWMKRRWIHWLELPSKRRVICRESLILKTSAIHTGLATNAGAPKMAKMAKVTAA